MVSGAVDQDLARKGQECIFDKPEELRRSAMPPDAFTKELFFLVPYEEWEGPAGAYKQCGRPS